MSRAAARFKQVDLARAIKAVQSTGLTVTGTRIDASGTIEVLCSKGNTEPVAEGGVLDQWLSKKGRDNAHRHKI